MKRKRQRQKISILRLCILELKKIKKIVIKHVCWPTVTRCSRALCKWNRPEIDRFNSDDVDFEPRRNSRADQQPPLNRRRTRVRTVSAGKSTERRARLDACEVFSWTLTGFRWRQLFMQLEARVWMCEDMRRGAC